MFVQKFSDDDFIILLLYVDDMLIVRKNLTKIVQLKNYEGFEIDEANSWYENQSRSKRKDIIFILREVIEKVFQRFHMDKSKVVSSLLATHFRLSSQQSPTIDSEKDDMSRVLYASTIGSLIYAMVCTRLDIAHAIGTISHFLSNMGREHWNVVKWIWKNLRGTSGLSLTFGGEKSLLVGYTDTDMAGDVDSQKSISRYLVKFVDGFVAWQSRLQKCVALSTTEAEFIVTIEAWKELLWMEKYLHELGFRQVRYVLFFNS